MLLFNKKIGSLILLTFCLGTGFQSSVAKKKQSDHKQLQETLKNGTITSQRLDGFLKYHLKNDPEILQGLEGTRFHWEAFWIFLPRYIVTIAWILFVNPFCVMLPGYLGILKHIPGKPLSLSIYVLSWIFGEKLDVVFKKCPFILWSHSKKFKFFMVCCVTWKFLAQLKEPSYLLIALNSSKYKSTEDQKAICKVILKHMKRKGIPFRKGMLVQSTAEEYIEAFKQNEASEDEMLKKLYEEDWLYYTLQIHIKRKFMTYTTKRVAPIVIYGNPMHLAKLKQWDDIVDIIKNMDPETSKGLGFAIYPTKTLNEITNAKDESPQGTLILIWKLLASVIWEDLPIEWKQDCVPPGDLPSPPETE